jgi:hypothetical protein
MGRVFWSGITLFVAGKVTVISENPLMTYEVEPLPEVREFYKQFEEIGDREAFHIPGGNVFNQEFWEKSWEMAKIYTTKVYSSRKDYKLAVGWINCVRENSSEPKVS